MGNSESMNGASDDININEWVIVNSPGGRYLGKVAGLKKDILEQVSNGDCLEISPALDFLAPLRPVQTQQGVAMTRDPIIVPPDFTMHALPIYVKAAAIYFCCDMEEADKKTYKELVRGGLHQALQARAQASGLTLAGGPVPPSGKVIPSRG